MPITLDLPPALVQEAKAFAESRNTTLERMLVDCLNAELQRERKVTDWEADFDRLVQECAKNLPGREPYKFNRADAYPEDVFA